LPRRVAPVSSRNRTSFMFRPPAEGNASGQGREFYRNPERLPIDLQRRTASADQVAAGANTTSSRRPDPAPCSLFPVRLRQSPSEGKPASSPQGSVSGDQWKNVIAPGFAVNVVIDTGPLSEVGQSTRQTRCIPVKSVVSLAKFCESHEWNPCRMKCPARPLTGFDKKI